jgi:hypothetical protein
MAMSKRSSEGEQEEISIAHGELARAPGHPFYERLNEVIESAWSLKRQRLGIDATTLEANAAMRSIVRRDTGESYEEFLRGLPGRRGLRRRRGKTWCGWTASAGNERDDRFAHTAAHSIHKRTVRGGTLHLKLECANS